MKVVGTLRMTITSTYLLLPEYAPEVGGTLTVTVFVVPLLE